MPLLASVATCIFLTSKGVQFNFLLWLMIDLIVLAGILIDKIQLRSPIIVYRIDITARDVVILALFAPAWVFYIHEPETREQGTFAVVVAQLFLTFPVARAAALIQKIKSWWKDGGSEMKLVAA